MAQNNPLDLLQFIQMGKHGKNPLIDLTGAFRGPASQDPLPGLLPQTAQYQTQIAENSLGSGQQAEQPVTDPVFRGPTSDEAISALTESPEEKAARIALEQERRQNFQRMSDETEQANRGLQGLSDSILASQQVDLSPLLALSDAWTGSKLAQSYKKPLTADERAAKAAEIQNMISKNKLGLTKEYADLLDKQASGQQNLRIAEFLGRQGRHETKIENEVAENISKKVHKDIMGQGKAGNENFENVENMMAGMEQAFQEGTLLSVSTALSTFARFVATEKGVLTDTDIKRIVPATLDKVLVDIQAWANSNPGEPIPRNLLDPYIKIINRVKKNIVQNKTRQLDNAEAAYKERKFYKESVTSGSGRVDFDKTRQRLKEFAGEASPASKAGPVTKTIGNKTYVQVPGGWEEQ